MVWKLRKDNEEIPPARFAPEYGPNSDYFTIRMYHSGKIVELNGRYYVDGKVDYFDWCHEDEMSVLELNEMAKELGLNDVVHFLHNRGMPHDCNYVSKLEHDIDTLCLVNFADDERVTEIYVQHESSVQLSANESDIDTGNEPVGGTENEHVGGTGNEPLDLSDGLIDMNDSDGSDGQSVGEDSDHSDFLADSDFYDSDDDIQYDDNVDFDVEWGGLREKSKTEPTNRRSRRLNKTVDEEGSSKKKLNECTHSKFPVFNEKLDMSDPKFQLGLCFNDAESFRRAVRQHSIVHGRDIKFKKNEKNKVQVICKHKTCDWTIYASQLRNEATFQIKSLNAVHECNRKERVTCATSRWVANKYKDKLASDPKWPVDSMMSIVQKYCKLLFSRHQMYRAKKKATELNTGSSVEQYGLMWRYAAEVVKTNHGTTIRIKTKPVGDGNEMRFKRVYLCWGALKEGFLSGCRPIIFLDGCHLKTSYGGVLLCAVGIDANNGIYPFAYAVVEKEKKDSWLWFIELLKTDLNIENSGLWTVMSDKQKGLIDAVELLLPFSEHRFCVMHLYSNFKLSHRGLALKNILWKAARASRIVDFERVMRELGEKDKSAFKWLAKRPAAHWSRSYFNTNSKCDVLLNNMCESFNAMIGRARSLPIIDMLEAIRMILMKRIHLKRDKMAKYSGDICPNIQRQLDDLKKKSMDYIAHWNGKDQFEVESCYGEKFKVQSSKSTLGNT